MFNESIGFTFWNEWQNIDFFHYILIFLDVPVSVASRLLQLYLGRIYKSNKPEIIICKKKKNSAKENKTLKQFDRPLSTQETGTGITHWTQD